MHRRSDSLVTRPRLRASYGIGPLAELAGMTRTSCSGFFVGARCASFVSVGCHSFRLTELEDRVPTPWRYLHTIDEGKRVAKR